MLSSVGFLIGSGVSCAGGAPSVGALTQTVLTKEYCRYSDGTIGPGRQPLDRIDETGPRARRALQALQEHFAPYYQSSLRRAMNYEDLLYIVGQLADEYLGDLDNPLVALGGDRARQILESEWKTHDRSYLELDRYIKGVVCAELNATPRPSALEFLADGLHALSSRTAVFTLNHDAFIEYRLPHLVDGFTAFEKGIFGWDFDSIEHNQSNAFLLKLHGSIEWWRDPRQGDRIIRVNSSADPDLRRLLGPPQVILAGTFNKIFGYTTGIFGDLFELFRRELRRLDVLVICGYGFGDKGINTQIIEWQAKKPNRVLILIHPAPSELAQGARGAIRRSFDVWKSAGVLRIVEKGAQDVSWADISALLGGARVVSAPS